MFYIIPTPIGNMKDITLRALDVLKSLDILYAENTSRTSNLLSHFQITVPNLRKYTEHKEYRYIPEIISNVEEGKKVGIVSDGGYPIISDPGYKLIREIVEKNLPFEVLPGATSIIPALIYSALPPDKFIFIGFLPKSEKKLLDIVNKYKGISVVCFESPHRIIKTMNVLSKNFPGMKVTFASEMTKMFQKIKSGTPCDILIYLNDHDNVKGEIVLVFYY